MFGRNNAPAVPIEKQVFEGQALLVQVIKDPIGTKGARLSTQISLAGRLLVYLPQEAHIGVSQRIEDEEERLHLRDKLQQLLPPDITGGFIVRTMAETASDRELSTDIDYLRKLWSDIQEKAKSAAPAAALYQDLNLGLRVARDFVNDDTTRILIDSRETFQKVQTFAQEFTPNVAPRLEHYAGERPLFDLYAIEDEIQKALARRVIGVCLGHLDAHDAQSHHHHQNRDDDERRRDAEGAHGDGRQHRAEREPTHVDAEHATEIRPHVVRVSDDDDAPHRGIDHPAADAHDCPRHEQRTERMEETECCVAEQLYDDADHDGNSSCSSTYDDADHDCDSSCSSTYDDADADEDSNDDDGEYAARPKKVRRTAKNKQLKELNQQIRSERPYLRPNKINV